MHFGAFLLCTLAFVLNSCQPHTFKFDKYISTACQVVAKYLPSFFRCICHKIYIKKVLITFSPPYLFVFSHFPRIISCSLHHQTTYMDHPLVRDIVRDIFVDIHSWALVLTDILSDI